MKFYIIDGYNVIFSSYLKIKPMEKAREELLAICKSRFGANFLLVFDGREGIISESREKRVVFTKSMSADDYIKKYVEKEKNRNAIVVISRDKALIDYCRYLGTKTQGPELIFKTEHHPRGEERGLSIEEERKITEELKKIWGLDD